MRPDFTSVAPVFRKDADAYSFVGLIVFLLMLPLLINFSGLVSVRDRFYSAKTDDYFYPESDYREIFENRGDIDVLVIGGCQIVGAIEPKLLEKELSALDGKKKTVVVLSQILAGQDFNYFMLKELLKRRKVGTILWQAPAVDTVYRWPNPSAHIWSGLNDDEMWSPARAEQRWLIYSQTVFLGLRDLLSILRPNLDEPSTAIVRERLEVGDSRKLWRSSQCQHPVGEFTDFLPVPPTVSKGEIVYDTNPGIFTFKNSPLEPYQGQFLKRSFELIHAKKIPLIILHVPTISDPDPTHVTDRLPWPDIAKPCTVIGIPSERLFAGIAQSDKYLLFWDQDHFNGNGRRLFSKTMTRGIAQCIQQMK